MWIIKEYAELSTFWYSRMRRYVGKLSTMFIRMLISIKVIHIVIHTVFIVFIGV